MAALPISDDFLLVRTEFSGESAWHECSPPCELCGQPIGPDRFEALPRAMTGMACASSRKLPRVVGPARDGQSPVGSMRI